MGSFAAEYPIPLLATYAGTKSFLKAWSKALGLELAPKGVTVRLLNSYLVVPISVSRKENDPQASKMSKIRNSSLMVPTPNTIVTSIMSTIGRTDGEPFVFTPFWAHAFFHFLYQRLPETLLMNLNLKMHNRIKERAQKKVEAKKAQ
ncbi:Very-long-chain 3-oxoacyl-CoA reductase [Neolecta irregularis DAH-3]|uniref:Very-long-chain 3-oxoacyl-CoA reductase n=1 Tax=Neolecta irregularis (strain DAH-3) TaxID=1198029 RepID=A0A1U7LK30_NEOID|nr:Very-long-chain 3-oxoacyl-CoA reductase [Neolecta irregularis DAH-3]|eukprot:OLL22988.1 Very-long-chain 3-oxoacyl-CoA reductase [Neolecta irregularis DAH-3]